MKDKLMEILKKYGDSVRYYDNVDYDISLYLAQILSLIKDNMPKKKEQTEQDIFIQTENEIKIGRWAFTNGRNSVIDDCMKALEL